MTKQPWYKEGRRPQRIETCSECGRTFRDKRTAEDALLQAIFGGRLCPECKAKEDTVICTACNEPVEKSKVIYLEGQPHHPGCMYQTDVPTYCIACRRLNDQHDEGCPNR